MTCDSHKAKIEEIIHRYTPLTLYPTAPLYNNHIWHGTLAETNFLTRKIMNSTVLPSCYFGTSRQGFSAASLTWPVYVGSRKRENCSVWKDRIIVASTCRRSVQFGCYKTNLGWQIVPALWQKYCLKLYNFTIPRLPWQASMENVTLRVRTCRKPFLIGWIHSLWGPCQPPVTFRI